MTNGENEGTRRKKNFSHGRHRLSGPDARAQTFKGRDGKAFENHGFFARRSQAALYAARVYAPRSRDRRRDLSELAGPAEFSDRRRSRLFVAAGGDARGGRGFSRGGSKTSPVVRIFSV